MQSSQSTHGSSGKSALEQCNAYIHWQIKDKKDHSSADTARQSGPAVTISYQTGACAHEIAVLLAKRLQAADLKGDVPWTVFDHHLVEAVLDEHHLPQSLAKHMPEERRSYIQDVIEELAGIRPPSWVTVPQVAETVLHLADSGHVILVGRGASVITGRMARVFHVKLISPLPVRIARVRETNHLTSEEAAKLIAQSDRGRGRYAKDHFHVSIEDDLLYHLVINTDRIPIPDAVELIACGARRCFNPNSEVGSKRVSKKPQ